MSDNFDENILPDIKVVRPPPYSYDLAMSISKFWKDVTKPSCTEQLPSGPCENDVVWWHPNIKYGWCDLHCKPVFQRRLTLLWRSTKTTIAINHLFNETNVGNFLKNCGLTTETAKTIAQAGGEIVIGFEDFKEMKREIKREGWTPIIKFIVDEIIR